MFGGALPPIFIWGHGCMWGLASVARRLGRVFQTVHCPSSPEVPQPWWLCPAAVEAPLGASSSPPGPGAGWAPAVLSEASGSTGRFGVTMQPGQQGPRSGRPL